MPSLLPNRAPRQLWEQIDTAFAHMQGQEDAGQGLAMKVAAHARQHFREPITLKDTAERFFMSSAYLGRIFQKAVGVPFKQYVNDLRIEEAKRLLRQTDKLIYEIAEETGFAESKYFVARFTAAAGVSPMAGRFLLLSALLAGVPSGAACRKRQRHSGRQQHRTQLFMIIRSFRRLRS